MAILTTTNQGLNFIGGTTFIQTGTSTVMSLQTSGNVGIGTPNPAAKLDVVGNIKSPTNSLSTTAAPTSFGVYTSEVRLIDTPNGGLKKCRVITDVYGEWILVGRFAASAMNTIANAATWGSVSGMTTGTAQNETTQFSADFGDSFPSEVRIMGATDFTSWRDTRTVDFVYKVPEGRKWKFFFSGGVENGMVQSTKFGWNINGAYDGFGRWVNTAQNFVRMSDGQVNNPSAAYTTATANAFAWDTADDAKITVSATRVFSGQDTFETAGFGNDDNIYGFFDEYPNETSNMQGGVDFSSAAWVLIKLPEGASGSGGSGTNYWAANGNDISNTNSGNVGIGTTSPEILLTLSKTTNNTSLGFFNTGTNAANRNWTVGSNDQLFGDFVIKTSNAIGGNPISAGVARLYISPTGNVGIGTDSPLGKLQVTLPAYDNEDTNSQQAIFGVDNGGGLRIGYNETSNKGYINVLKPAVAWGSLVLQSGGGNVGIGTTSLTVPLEVNGGAMLTNQRVDNAEKYPIGHYQPGETLFEIDTTWTDAQLRKYFGNNNVSWNADADAPGGYAIYINGGVSVGGEYGSGFPYIPVDDDGIYYMECYIKNVGTSQSHYMGSNEYNESFASTGGNPGSYGYWVMSNTNPGSSWTKVSGYITDRNASQTGKFELGTKYWTPLALFNYGAGSGTRACLISGWKVVRVDSPGDRYFDSKVYINAGASIPNRSEEFQVTGRQIITNTGTNSAALYLGYNSSGSNTIQLGRGRTADGLSYIDLNGEVMSAGDYGFRIMRRAGVNAVTDLIQVGTGNLTINASNGANTVFTNTNVGIGTTGPAAKLHVKESSGSTSQIKMSAASNEANYGYLTMTDNTVNTAKLTFGTTYGYNTPVPAMTVWNGMVGIGTTSPLAGLDISNTNASIYQQWSYDNPGANNYNLQLTETVTSGNVRFVFDQKNAGTQYSDVLVFNQGKIGMGTDEPDGQLNISKSTSGITPALTLTNNQYGAADNTGSSIRFQGYSLFNPGSSNPRYSEIIGVNGSGSVPKRIDFKFTADADVKTPLSVLQTGNVGIGTTSPDAKLEVAGGSTGIRLSNVGDSGAYDSIEMTYNGYNSGTPEMKFRPTQTPGSGNINSYFRFINSNGNSTTANNRANITVDNQVGIGPTGIFTSNHILNLSGTGIAIKNDTNGSSNNWSSIKNTAAASGSNLVFLTATGTNIMDDTGRLGIGVTGPSYKLDVAGTIRATGDVIAYSDARVKDNVVTIGNALEKVTQLRGVSYTRNDVDDTTTKIGVIAQEVLEVLPEVVQEDDEGKYSVAYGNMVGLLIESIKELKAEVDELKSRL